MQGYSSGCFACRRRKVKCDEQKPGCARCERRSEKCSGYRDRSELIFRSMNANAAAKAGHMIQYHGSKAQIETFVQQRFDNQPTRNSLMTLKPTLDWEDTAINHFFHNFILVPSEGRRGYLEFLPGLCASNYDSLVPRHALLAASMASFANVAGLGQVRIEALRHYSLALCSVRHMLEDSVSASSNCLLASIVLLQKFEIISGHKEPTVDPHEEALVRLQNQRTVEDLMMPIGQSLSFAIQSRLYISELDGKRPNSSPVENDLVIQTQLVNRAPLWQLFSRTARICRRIRNLIATADRAGNRNKVKKIFQQLFEVYGELNSWPTSVSSNDKFRSIPASEMQATTSPFPPAYHVFDSVQHSSLWLSYWCMRLHFLQHMQIFVQNFGPSHAMISSSVPSLLNKLHIDQRSTVEDICSMSSYMLGELGQDGRLQSGTDSKALGAFFLTRGLYVANQLEDLSPTQRGYILDRMLQIGHSKGIAQALRGRERWLQAHLDFTSIIQS